MTAPNATGQEFRYGYDDNTGEFTFMASGHPSTKLLLLLRGVQVSPAASVIEHQPTGAPTPLLRRKTLDQLYDAAQGWYADYKKGELWLIPGDSSLGLKLSVRGIM